MTEFEFLPDLDAVLVCAEGELSPRVLERWLQDMLEDPRFDLRMHQVFDLQGATGLPLSMAQMHAYVRVGAGFNRGTGRVAMIAQGDLMFGLARMFEATASMTLEREIGIFHSRAEAFAWLRQAPPR